MGQLVFQATLGGQVALVGPNTASSYSLNIPAVSGNVVTTGDTGTVTNTMLASSAYTAPGTIGSGTPNTGAFTTLSATSFTNTGNDSALAFIPTGATVPTNGLYLPASNKIGLATNSTNAITIDASQNVGIGTTTPTQKLDVTNGRIAMTEVYDIRWIGTGNTIRGSISADSGSNLYFGTGSSNTERMRIDSSGNVLVGTTAVFVNSKSNIAFDQAGASGLGIKNTNATATGYMIAFYNSSNSLQGSITQTNSTTIAYNTSSDYRLKENVAPMTGALDTVAQLRPVTYDWITDKSKGQGFIAHELQAVVPDCVTGEKDAVDADGNPQYQGIDTSFLVATLTASIQELKAIVDAQAEQVTALQAQVATLTGAK
jgi:hypothetical protein